MENKKSFWIRLIIYILAGGIVPFVFLVIQFKLFSPTTSITLGGWGIVAIIFLGLFLSKLLKSLRCGMPFSYTKQVLDGVCNVVLPLVITAVIFYTFKDFTTEICNFLCCLVICESVAIAVNPIPKWAHDNNVEESQSFLQKLLESLGIIKSDKK